MCSKKECLCCKFVRCHAEFEKHRSHTSFAALDRCFEPISRWFQNPESIQQDMDRICDEHKADIQSWLTLAYRVIDSLKGGVYLPKIKSR